MSGTPLVFLKVIGAWLAEHADPGRKHPDEPRLVDRADEERVHADLWREPENLVLARDLLRPLLGHERERRPERGVVHRIREAREGGRALRGGRAPPEPEPLPGPALVHALRQSRQIRTGSLQYFDTPYLGVLARVTATSGE